MTYTEEELKQVPGEFTPSPFVKKITGVDNVCERSAVLASGNGRLLQRKTGENGVTTAVLPENGGYILSKIYVIGIGPGAYDQMTGKRSAP